MGQITIQCRLVASPTTRQQLWQMMSKLNTPLVNELLIQIRDQPDFETWRRRGNLPSSVAAQLCSSLKTDPRFSGQPARFYASAAHVADYIFKSWLAIQKRLQGRIDRKSRWLEKLKSDEELQELSGCSLPELRAKAASILERVSQPTKTKSRKTKLQEGTSQASEPEKDTTNSPSLFNTLFQRYEQTEDVLEQCAIAYILKNRCQLPEEEEDPQKFAQYRRKVEIQIERLQEQVEARLPKGRDLTGRSWLEILETATTTVPKDNTEAKRWQDRLLTDPSNLPFPLIFETNEDLVWSRNEKGRICVHFNGLREHTFQVYCDKRHLHWFQRFLEDQETKRASKNQHSSALFTLRASRLAWTEGESKDAPWERNHLTLFCTVDNRLWSAEGTEQVRQEKAIEVAQKLTQMQGKSSLSESQQGYIKRLNSTLDRINSPFNRPNKLLYQGQSHILVGISLGFDKPATLVVWDAQTETVLASVSFKQLLGDHYPLFLRQRRQQQKTDHQRHKAQKQGASNSMGESNLGQHVDRLIAKQIVAIAQSYKASSIAVPDLKNIRSLLNAEIQSRAEQKCPGSIEAQKRYTKQYRTSIHRWSYSRLIEATRTKASKLGIAVEIGKQPYQGSEREKAVAVAIAAYHARE